MQRSRTYAEYYGKILEKYPAIARELPRPMTLAEYYGKVLRRYPATKSRLPRAMSLVASGRVHKVQGGYLVASQSLKGKMYFVDPAIGCTCPDSGAPISRDGIHLCKHFLAVQAKVCCS